MKIKTGPSKPRNAFLFLGGVFLVVFSCFFAKEGKAKVQTSLGKKEKFKKFQVKLN